MIPDEESNEVVINNSQDENNLAKASVLVEVHSKPKFVRSLEKFSGKQKRQKLLLFIDIRTDPFKSEFY